MATMTTQKMRETTPAPAPAVIRSVEAPALVCGDCAFHIPHATRPGGWCAQAKSELRWQQVSPRRSACGEYSTWPEGSPVPAFLEAMKF